MPISTTCALWCLVSAPPSLPPHFYFPIHYTGHWHVYLSLRVLFSVVDAYVNPSRQDNLPNTGLESYACGSPLVVFNTGGLPDIVDYRVTGALAQPFDSKGFSRRFALGADARDRAERLFNPARVARLYQENYAIAKNEVEMLFLN